MVALCIDGCRLSVHLSISSLTLSQEQNDIERKLKIGRKEAHDVGDLWPHFQVERSNVKVIRLKSKQLQFQSEATASGAI